MINNVARSLLKAPILSFRYLRERKILTSEIQKSNLTGKSLLFFTTQKCASTLIPRLIKELLDAELLSGTVIDYASYLWNFTNHDAYEHMRTHEARLFCDRGYIFAPLRRFVSVSSMENYRVILFLRDPRDVLVSSYYSKAFSHALPFNRNRRKYFLEERSLINSMVIDEYVLNQALLLLQKYEEYRVGFVQPPIVITYEEMINNPANWLVRLLKSLEIDAHIKLVDELVLKLGLSKKVAESPSAHIRKKLPGDHLNKLSSNTVQELNLIFDEILEWLYYE